MSRTIYYTAMSIDGRIADASNSLDWLLQFGQPDGGDYEDFIRDVGAIAMGATTYEWLLDHHIKPGRKDTQPWPYAQPAWIFTSRDLPRVDGADIRFAAGDVRAAHRDMQLGAAGKNIWLAGGGRLAAQFFDQGLVDELIVTVAPVLLGAGAPLLPCAHVSGPLRLRSARPWGGVFVRLHYDVTSSTG